MRQIAFSAAFSLVLCAATNCWSQGFVGGHSRVYGAGGGLQAHSQYGYRFASPWHGGGRIGGRHYYVNTPYFSWVSPGGPSYGPAYPPYGGYFSGYPGSGYSGLGFSVSYSYPGYGYPIGYAYTPMAPLVMQGQPLWVGGDPSDNAVMRGALEEEARRWQQPLDATEKPKARRLPQPSTPDAKLKSLRLQLRGDAWLKEQDYTQAYQRFQQAVDAAEDRPEAHFRLGFALVALGRYELAVKNFKRGLEIDPALPLTGSNLDAIYGKENRLAISSFTHKVADWVREDIRDPDRLFLMGLLLHFDDDHDRSTPFFETAYRLAGEGSHLVAFLNPVEPEANKPAGGQVGPAPLAPGEAGLKPPAAGIPPQPAAPVIQPKIIVPPGAPNPPRLETNPQRQREAAGGPKLPPLPEP